MKRKQAIIYGESWLEDEYLDAKDREFIEEALQALKQESCEDVAKERYEDLCEYFGGAKDILKNREDFKAWLGRVKWHIHKAEELSAENDDLRDQLAMRDRFQKQEPCEDEYIKVPKKALKYRTAGMVAYNAEWLKNHFDIERVAICGTQQPCEDAISRQAVDEIKELMTDINGDTVYAVRMSDIRQLPSVNPQEPKTGHWIQTNEFFINQDGQFIYKFICSECKSLSHFRKSNKKAIGANVCPNCGCRMVEPQESEDKE